MGFILTPQRQAIEELCHKATRPPSSINKRPLTLTDGTRVCLLGVSEGIGSCSEIKGMHVLVVCLEPTGQVELYRPVKLSQPSEEYAYVVLSRGVTDAERATFYGSDQCNQGLGCVELLRHVRSDERGICLECTGDAVVYVSIM